VLDCGLLSSFPETLIFASGQSSLKPDWSSVHVGAHGADPPWTGEWARTLSLSGSQAQARGKTQLAHPQISRGVFFMNRLSDREEPIRRPDSCPFCHSKAVGTLAKEVTAATYWRCQACGEVWNVARLESSRTLR
jgi:hypothetical protein